MTKSMIQDNSTLLKEIAIHWCIQDVQEIRPDLTDEQVSDVLKYIK